jgi:hypothetical protein
MTPIAYYAELCGRHRAYSWAPPIPYDRWLTLWWPTISKQVNP